MEKNFRFFSSIFVGWVLMGGCLFFSDRAQAALTVGSSPCTYATIGAAITAASPGEMLLIEGGVIFYENITIGKNLTLEGGYNGCGSGVSTTTTVTGNGSGSVVVITPGFTVTLEELVLTNGNSAGEGGGIYFAGGTGGGLLTLNNVEIHGNRATWGGGIWSGLNSEIQATGVNIHNNHATEYGGGVRLYNSSSATFTGSNIDENSAPNGGGIYLDNDSSELNFSGTINNNSASLNGGGIYQGGGTVAFNGPWSVDNNSAIVNGGAIAISGTGTARFRASGGTGSLSNNRANGNGGAVSLQNNSTVQLYATNGYDLQVLGNHTGGSGGAFFADSGGYFDTYGQLIIDGNNASGNGGAFYLTNGSRVWFDDYVTVVPRILSNWAQNGGAIYAVNSPRVECDGAEFGNTPIGNYAANGSGGAIYLSNSDLNAENCKFYYNRATQHGGAIVASTSSSLQIRANCSPTARIGEHPHEINAYILPLATPCDPSGEECSSLNNNIADSDNDGTGDGGAIYTNDSSLEMSQTYLHYNRAYRGGALYQTGAAASANVSNCLIHHNTVLLALGAGIRRSSGLFSIAHTTLADNIGGSGFSGVATSATNTIAWGNSEKGFSIAPTEAVCNIDDGGLAGVNVDPYFVAPGIRANYHLRKNSPAIDTCATGLAMDLDGRLRPHDGLYDMGAYEFYFSAGFNPALMSAIMAATRQGGGK